MLIHEWIRYRNEQVQEAVKRREGETGDEAEGAEQGSQGPGPDAEGITEAEVLRSLQTELQETGASMQERLAQLRARQRQLPIDIEQAEADAEPDAPRGASETREELVRRLLDPTLGLKDCALLLGVCATTVRRYTNRGLLRCFRTPGNQRRFRLSDVLEFMERRDREGEV